jgi:hypothetical protein
MYEYFDYLTRRELRPSDPAMEKVMLDTIEKTRADLLELSVLARLDNSQQLQLAALVCDFKAKYEMFQNLQRQVTELRRVPKLLGARTISKIQKAARILRPIADRLPEEHPFAGGKKLKAVVAALEEMPRNWTAPTSRELADLVKSLREQAPQSEDPTSLATWQLYWFFVEECSLRKDEAEVRVAKIGKAFLEWKRVRYRSRSSGPDAPKGCITVRQRIRRFKRKLVAMGVLES